VGVIINNNLGCFAREISRNRGLPLGTVQTCLKDYLSGMTSALANGERVILNGMASISVYRDGQTGELFPRGRVSPALQKKLRDSGVTLSTSSVDDIPEEDLE
jgi:hypothetical protein